MSPTESSGTEISTAITGSSITGSAFAYASRNASEPAILNAISEESTLWYEPSTSVMPTPTTGNPASSPLTIDSCTPLSTAPRKLCGITPPTILSWNS